MSWVAGVHADGPCSPLHALCIHGVQVRELSSHNPLCHLHHPRQIFSVFRCAAAVPHSAALAEDVLSGASVEVSRQLWNQTRLLQEEHPLLGPFHKVVGV